MSLYIFLCLVVPLSKFLIDHLMCKETKAPQASEPSDQNVTSHKRERHSPFLWFTFQISKNWAQSLSNMLMYAFWAYICMIKVLDCMVPGSRWKMPLEIEVPIQVSKPWILRGMKKNPIPMPKMFIQARDQIPIIPRIHLIEANNQNKRCFIDRNTTFL